MTSQTIARLETPSELHNAIAAIRTLALAGWQHLLTALERDRQRRQLAELPAERLVDIGITRAEAVNEARKGFWVV